MPKSMPELALIPSNVCSFFPQDQCYLDLGSRRSHKNLQAFSFRLRKVTRLAVLQARPLWESKSSERLGIMKKSFLFYLLPYFWIVRWCLNKTTYCKLTRKKLNIRSTFYEGCSTYNNYKCSITSMFILVSMYINPYATFCTTVIYLFF